MDVDPQRAERRYWWIALGAVAVGLAVTVFKVPLGTLLGLGVLLLCPLLMYGMHNGHGHRRSPHHEERDDLPGTASASGGGKDADIR